jgi:hypothetical protein
MSVSKTSPEAEFSMELVNLSISISTNIFSGLFTYQRYKISANLPPAKRIKASCLSSVQRMQPTQEYHQDKQECSVLSLD